MTVCSLWDLIFNSMSRSLVTVTHIHKKSYNKYIIWCLTSAYVNVNSNVNVYYMLRPEGAREHRQYCRWNKDRFKYGSCDCVVESSKHTFLKSVICVCVCVCFVEDHWSIACLIAGFIRPSRSLTHTFLPILIMVSLIFLICFCLHRFLLFQMHFGLIFLHPLNFFMFK